MFKDMNISAIILALDDLSINECIKNVEKVLKKEKTDPYGFHDAFADELGDKFPHWKNIYAKNPNSLKKEFQAKNIYELVNNLEHRIIKDTRSAYSEDSKSTMEIQFEILTTVCETTAWVKDQQKTK